MRSRLSLPAFLPLLILCLLAARPSHALRSDVLYSPQSGFLQVSPMRALTLNAHVTAFQYDPLGLEIACVGSETEGETTTHFVKVIDARTGHEMERLSFNAPTEPEGVYWFQLLGWLSSGRYLMLERFSPTTDNRMDGASSVQDDCLRWDISANPPSASVLSAESPLPEGANLIDTVRYLSPTGRWLAFMQLYEPAQRFTKGNSQISLYDIEKETTKILTLPPNLSFRGWFDEKHLKFVPRTSEEQAPQYYDAQAETFQDSVAAISASSTKKLSRQYPDFALDVEYRSQKDILQGSDGQIASYILWIRRMPKSKKPLGVAAAGLTPGGDDPHAAWSPNGKQIMFIVHGDLCVTDIEAIPASEALPQEKLAVGLPLTCAEERALAESNLKQIGLAIIQYAQDYDEHFPPAAGFEDNVYPYLKDRELFEVAGHRFVYKQPVSLLLAAMEDPAATEMGEMDMPCARVALFGDGHVRSYPKTGAAIE